MSVWSTKSSGIEREYIVIRHSLRGVNTTINGIKFRDSYAVVEKNSKTYRMLKQIPVLKSAIEYPLTFLRKLKFVTRPLDVKNIYGADVYTHYIKELEVELSKEKENIKVEADKNHVEKEQLCSIRTERTEELCSWPALSVSPSGYCKKHILVEPRLQELGIEIPRFIIKKERAFYKEKVVEKLTELKKAGSF